MSSIAEQRKHWNEKGFLVLPGFFSPEEVRSLDKLMNYLWDNKKYCRIPLVIDAFIDTAREKRTLFSNIELEARNHPYKLNDLYLNYPEVREIILDRRLYEILGELLGGKPLAFNTLSFERGSQQFDHFDTFYMPPLVKDKMLATWIAIEDGHMNSGPLRYYPGSHRIPPYIFSHGRIHAIPEEMPLFEEYIRREIKNREIEVQHFIPKAGDVFIWHGQLLHGGERIKDMSLTRKSIVTHYFRYEDMQNTPRIDTGGGRFFLSKPHLTPIG